MTSQPTPVEPAPPSGHDPAPAFEFGRDQERVLGELAVQLRFLGFAALVYGGLSLLAGLALFVRSGRLIVDLNGLLGGLIALALGAWSLSAGRSFRAVVRTTGRDVSHLMQALHDLRNILGLICTLLLLVLAVFALVLVLVLTGGLEVIGADAWLTVGGHPAR